MFFGVLRIITWLILLRYPAKPCPYRWQPPWAWGWWPYGPQRNPESLVSGTAEVTCDENVFLLCENPSTYIPIASVQPLPRSLRPLSAVAWVGAFSCGLRLLPEQLHRLRRNGKKPAISAPP